MSEEILAKAHEVLDNYMESNHHRRTPERSTILDTIYSMGEHFSIEDLGRELLKKNFRVSRATLYNTLHLFLELRLVVKHSLADGTKYEASYSEDNHVHQVCTICGKVTEIVAPQVTAAVKDIRMQRFRKDAYALYIYGVCSGCQSKMARKRKKNKYQDKKIKNEHR